MNQPTFFDLEYGQRKRKTRREEFLGQAGEIGALAASGGEGQFRSWVGAGTSHSILTYNSNLQLQW